MNWTARQIGSYLARFTFHRKHLVMVPNCSWPGAECDLLVVTNSLRIIDVEVKISRSDLKADAAKGKWYHDWDWSKDGPHYEIARRRKRDYPLRVWKHYYCLPDEIWTPDLIEHLPAVSGVLLLRQARRRDNHGLHVHVERIAKPRRDAERLSAEEAIDIARLASLRMWDALKLAEEMRQLYEEKFSQRAA